MGYATLAADKHKKMQEKKNSDVTARERDPYPGNASLESHPDAVYRQQQQVRQLAEVSPFLVMSSTAPESPLRSFS